MINRGHSMFRFVVAANAAAAAALTAALMQPLLSLAPDQAIGMALLFLAVGYPIAMLHILVLGLPAYLILRQCWRLRWWNSAIAGFVIGALPTALFMFDPAATFYQAGRTVLIDAGRYTAAGWLDYSRTVVIAGLFGTVGGLAFWLVLRDAKKGGPTPDRPSR